MAGACAERWKAARIVGDVVDEIPEGFGLLKVVYGGGAQVSDEQAMGRAQTSAKPHVELLSAIADPGCFYTLAMVDPDPPTPDNPVYRHWLHWLLINIPGDTGPSQEIWSTGTEIMPYAGPTPPAGTHRYVFLLYKQKGPLSLAKMQERKQFKLARFVKQYELGVPVSGLYYTVKHGD